MTEERSFDEWAIVESMGHGRAAGRLSEQNIAGAGFLRLDVPRPDGSIDHSKFYAPSAVYAITPVAKDVAISAAQHINNPPVARWELPVLQATVSSSDDPDVFEGM